MPLGKKSKGGFFGILTRRKRTKVKKTNKSQRNC